MDRSPLSSSSTIASRGLFPRVTLNPAGATIDPHQVRGKRRWEGEIGTPTVSLWRRLGSSLRCNGSREVFGLTARPWGK